MGTIIRVPPEDMFGENEFIPAESVEELGDALRERHHLPEVTVTYLWRKKGGKSGSKSTFGKCVKASGLAKYGIGTDFAIWLAADHCRDAKLTQHQFAALIYHEGLHADVDIDDKTGTITPVLRPHDVEEFADVLREFGTWNEDLASFVAAAKQAPLFEAGNGLAAVDKAVAVAFAP